MNNIIVVGGQKGGVGKTTIATNLAILRQQKTGNQVLLIDADDQGSSSAWSARRSQKSPELPPITVVKKFGDKDFIRTVKSLAEKYDDVIIDVGGRNTFELRAALISCDKFIMPIIPSQLDTETIGHVEAILDEALAFNPGLIAKVVPSKVSALTNELPELLDLKEDLENFTMTSSIIHERVIYRKVVKSGKSIFEIPNPSKDYNQKAVDEFTNLYNEIYV